MSASMAQATSRTRSDPLEQLSEVILTGTPRARHTAATSSESVATTTGSISPLDSAARQTHSTMGRPAISRNTLRLSRVEASRAGMTPAIRNLLMHASLQQRARRAHFRGLRTPTVHPSRFDPKSNPPYHLGWCGQSVAAPFGGVAQMGPRHFGHTNLDD